MFGALFGAILIGTLYGLYMKRLRIAQETGKRIAAAFNGENKRLSELGLPTLTLPSPRIGSHTLELVLYAVIVTAYIADCFSMMTGAQQQVDNTSANPAKASVQMGTIATCSEVRGFGGCSSKWQFRPGEELWVYSEVRNANRNGDIDVTFDIELVGPKGFHQKAHFEQRGKNQAGPAWSVDNAKFRLPSDSPPGEYTVKVAAGNNFTHQIGHATTVFSVVGGKQHDPIIESVTKILAQASQSIAITGKGFGEQAPFEGDSPHILISDVTGNWNAGNSGDGDLVTLNVTSWTDTRIVIAGFTGAYGDQWHLNTGDFVRIQVWNPETRTGPATITTIVLSGTEAGAPSVEN